MSWEKKEKLTNIGAEEVGPTDKDGAGSRAVLVIASLGLLQESLIALLNPNTPPVSATSYLLCSEFNHNTGHR